MLFVTLFIAVIALSLPAPAAPGRQDILFIENKGQILDSDGNPHPELLFYSQSGSNSVLFSGNTIHYVFSERKSLPGSSQSAFRQERFKKTDPVESVSSYRIDVEILGARPDAVLTAEDESSAKFNFYYAHCPQGISASSFRTIRYKGIYRNIDLVYYASGGAMKYDFIVHPGAKVSDIRLRYRGQADIRLGQDEQLHIAHPFGEMREEKPWSYQAPDESAQGVPAGSAAQTIACSYQLDNGVMSFRTAAYDSSRILVLDPKLVWSTYLGGIDIPGSAERPTGATLDKNGNICICGNLGNASIPATIGQMIYGGGLTDAFIMKLSGDGQQLLWVTYAGGSGTELSSGIAGDGTNICITGKTTSENFPVMDAFQPAYGGNGLTDGDAFVMKVNESGIITWSTYLGGSGGESGGGIAVDSSGNVTVTGTTFGNNFPRTDMDALLLGGYLSQFSSDGKLRWSRYYKPSSKVYAGSGNTVYAAVDNYDQFSAGNINIAVAEISPTGDLIEKYLGGGSDDEKTFGVVVDKDKNIIVVGITYSIDFPVTDNAVQKTSGSIADSGGTSDIFILKVDPAGTIIYSSYLGGKADDVPTSVATDSDGNIYVTGYTNNDFPLKNPFDPSINNQEAFIVQIMRDGWLGLSSYWGGTYSDVASSIVFNNETNEVIIAGSTQSADFPTTPNARQPQKSGAQDESSSDMFVTKFGCMRPLNPRISDADTVYLCEGDEMLLDPGPGFVKYSWSSKDITQNIVVRSEGSYSVEVEDKMGCTWMSNTVYVKVVSALHVRTFNGGILKSIINAHGCDSVVVQNNTDIPFFMGTKDVVLSRNMEIAMPLSQFPVIIAPHSSGSIQACLYSRYLGEVNDTLTLYPGGKCQVVLPLLGLVREDEYNGNLGCATPIELVKPDETLLEVQNIYPNPAAAEISIPVYASAKNAAVPHCELLNPMGEALISARAESGRIYGELREFSFRLDTRQLPSGAYFCRVSSGGKTIVKPLIVSH